MEGYRTKVACAIASFFPCFRSLQERELPQIMTVKIFTSIPEFLGAVKKERYSGFLSRLWFFWLG